MVLTDSGTKPGDPTADIIFCFLFHLYQSDLQQALDDEGLLVRLPDLGQQLCSHSTLQRRRLS